MTLRLGALLAASLTLLPGCTLQSRWDAVYKMVRTTFPDVEQLSPDSVAALLADSSQQVILLDVREEPEFTVSHLSGAIRVDPDADPLAVLEQLDLAGRGGHPRIVAYCSVGYRSSALAEKLTEALQERGVDSVRVSNLEGSIFQWANQGRTLVSGGGPATKVHPYDKAWGRLVDPRFRAELDGR